MPIDELPPVPSRGEDPSTFNDKADAFNGALPVFRLQANALQADVNTKQATASAAATTATTKAAEAAASAAAAAAAAPAYVSSNTYDWPQIVAYLGDGQTYRALAPVAAGETPAAHPEKWMKLSHSGTPDDATVTPQKLSAGAPSWSTGGDLTLGGGPTYPVAVWLDTSSYIQYSRIADELSLYINSQLVMKWDANGNVTMRNNKRVPCHFATGAALPTTDIGVIWHDDYNSWMTWQVFSANGAAYTGYASTYVGRLIPDSQPTARPGHVKTGNAALSKTGFYAALWNWALHNGLVVALGSWSAGRPVYADNGDGTFRTPDLRAESMRLWDDSRGVDTGRVFTSWQAGQGEYHNHSQILANTQGATEGPPNGYIGTGNPTYGAAWLDAQTNYSGGENRVRGFVQLGTIKA